MKELIVKELFATADRDGNYLDVSSNKEDCDKWLSEGNDKQATQIIKGYGVFFKDEDLMPDAASDFHYDKEEAEHELAFFSEETNSK